MQQSIKCRKIAIKPLSTGIPSRVIILVPLVGGSDGCKGRNILIGSDGNELDLGGKATTRVKPGVSSCNACYMYALCNVTCMAGLELNVANSDEYTSLK